VTGPDRLIVALDTGSVESARRLVDGIGDAATFYKIGYQLGFSGGLGLVRELVGAGKKVFLDFKLHDIGNTVEEGVRSAAGLGATFSRFTPTHRRCGPRLPGGPGRGCGSWP
jgi:orotidine-5'-phosphate decarboxylase